MKFIQISLTTACNLLCEYCPIKQYRNIAPRWPLNNDELIPFLERSLISKYSPCEYVVELTGGEPALYNGLDELLQFLSKNNIRTLIKTNGLLEIKKYPFIKRVAAFHNLGTPPKFYDEILIIKDTVDFENKCNYCDENKIPFKIIGKDKTPIKDDKHKFSQMSFINPAGHNVPCQSGKPIEKVTEDGTMDLNRIPFLNKMSFSNICLNCKAAYDAWRFLE